MTETIPQIDGSTAYVWRPWFPCAWFGGSYWLDRHKGVGFNEGGGPVNLVVFWHQPSIYAYIRIPFTNGFRLIAGRHFSRKRSVILGRLAVRFFLGE